MPASRSKNFNPRAPCGARRRPAQTRGDTLIFQSTRPLRGATEFSFAPYTGLEFQSTRPLRGATYGGSLRSGGSTFQSTRPLRGATRKLIYTDTVSNLISIHAPLAGRDRELMSTKVSYKDFNPRAPCGARPFLLSRKKKHGDFNPRAPCGARQLPIRAASFRFRFQSTRPLRGATALAPASPLSCKISIHAPLAGRDRLCPMMSTPPSAISIHAPLAGRDQMLRCRIRLAGLYFNPRAPCGARLSCA